MVVAVLDPFIISAEIFCFVALIPPFKEKVWEFEFIHFYLLENNTESSALYKTNWCSPNNSKFDVLWTHTDAKFLSRQNNKRENTLQLLCHFQLH